MTDVCPHPLEPCDTCGAVIGEPCRQPSANRASPAERQGRGPGMPSTIGTKMNNTSGLAELIERVERATGPDREIDRAVECALFGGKPMPRDPDRVHRVDGNGYGYTQAFAPYTSSLDLALGLLERVLPGWTIRLWISERQTACSLTDTVGVDEPAWAAPTPALALVLATLKAKAEIAP